MKKLVLLSALFSYSCLADIVCIANCSETPVTIKFHQGAYSLQECITDDIGIKSIPLTKQEVTLGCNEQYLLETTYTFCLPAEDCGFTILDYASSGKCPIVSMVDEGEREINVGDKLIEVIANDAGQPLEGQAFLSDRLYKITSSYSEPVTPTSQKRIPEWRYRSKSS